MKRKRLSLHMKVVLLWGIALCALCLCVLGVYLIDQKARESMLATYVNQQDEAVERVVHHMRNAYERDTAMQKSANTMFTSYIQEEPSSNGAYWFLYTQERILFERDAMQTALQDGKDLNILVAQWQSKGGKRLDHVMSLFQGQTRHMFFSKEEGAELESVSAMRLQIADGTYIVGNAIPLSQIYAIGTYGSYRNLIAGATAIVALIILIFALMMHRTMLENYQCITHQEEIMHNYHAQMTRMDEEVKKHRRQVKDYQLMDSLGLFYNRDYFYTLLLNMKRQNLKQLGMITVELENLHGFIDRYGLEYEQDVLVLVKDCLERCIVEESIVARVKDNRIVVTIISDDFRRMSEECNTLEKALRACNLGIPLKVYSMIQMQNESAMDMYERVDRVISHQGSARPMARVQR